MKLLLLLALASTLCAAAPVQFRSDDHGTWSVGDDAPVASVGLYVHDAQWGQAHQSGAQIAKAAPDRVEGAIPLTDKARGQVRFTETISTGPARVDLDYTLTFTEDTQINGAYVSVRVPVDRFAGQTVRFPGAGTSFTLPPVGGAVGTTVASAATAADKAASAFALPLSDDRSFVVACDAAGPLHIQDNRQYGDKTFELRFVLASGRVIAGHTIRRRVSLAVVPPGEVDKLAAELNPPRRFDPSKPHATVSDQGEIRIQAGEQRLLNAFLAIHGVGWAYTAQGSARDVAAGGDSRQRTFQGKLDVPAAPGKAMEFAETLRDPRSTGLDLDLSLCFPEAVRLNGYQLSFTTPVGPWIGREIALVGDQTTTVTPPVEYAKQMILAAQTVREVRVGGEQPGAFTIAVDPPAQCLVQDNREFGGDELEFRFNFRRQEAGEEVPAGETVRRAFQVRFREPLFVSLNEEAEPTQTEAADWVPFSLPWDRAALDVSFLNDKPAGAHGFLTVKGDQFVFADGTPARFWGTCFSAGANFPTHEQAEKIARRLAQYGVNIVRTHHADAFWAERCFFRKDADNTQEFDPESLDRFDYLISCLKREGIYVYLDQLVNRKFKPGDNVDAVDKLEVCAKPYSNFDPRLIELQQKFSHDLWTHVNPYTKLAYKDEPAIALMEFANENDLFSQAVTLEPYRSRLETRYRAWAQEQGIEVGPEPVSFTRETEPIIRFLIEVQASYYREMARYLRSLGVRVPMTGSNWSRNLALLAALQTCDYTDSHSYWDHPFNGRMNNRPMVRASRNVFDGLSFNRVVGKPFFVSEWDQPWANEWRAEHPLAMAAVAALQGWSGLTTYTYRHTATVPCDWLSGAFETFNDPCRFGLWYHAALIFRRGDVSPARNSVAIVFPEKQVHAAPSPTPWNLPALALRPEMSRLEMALSQGPRGEYQICTPEDDVRAPGQTGVHSDTSQLYRNWEKGFGTINTPRTQAAYGFIGEQGTVELRDLSLAIKTPFATVALSSLTDDMIRGSKHLLLTAVGRAENAGMRYNLTRTRVLDNGAGPILIEPIRGTVSIRTDVPNLQARPVAPDGTRGEPLKTAYEGGRLEFQIGESGTMYYEVTAAIGG